MKSFLLKFFKTNKILSAILTLFISTVGVYTIISNWQTKDISGEWHLTFYNDECDYLDYTGDSILIRFFFQQNKDVVSGEAEKWAYNGKELHSSNRRKLKFQGNVTGDKIELIYTLFGERRESTGKMSLQVSNNEAYIEGKYSGTAGNCKGKVAGKKLT